MVIKENKSKGIPWANCRLRLASDVPGFSDPDDELSGQGVFARLHYTEASHPAVRQSLQALEPISLSVPALALQSLVNRRGPDALIGCIPSDTTRHSARLLDLCTACHNQGLALTCTTPVAELVLVPRIPSIASRDHLFFVVYATNIQAVQLCQHLRLSNQVAVVLDIDQTLIDATPVKLTNNDYDSLEWLETSVQNSSGQQIIGHIAHAPGSDAGAPTQDRAFFIDWRTANGRTAYTFFVRVRRGWTEFRNFFITNAERFAPFICSKGKLEYVQLIWAGLDPAGRLLPRSLWSQRIVSTYPDTLANAANKTILSALGCAPVPSQGPFVQIAAPIIAIDDSPDAYEPEFSDIVLFVEEFRPSEAVHADKGSVLRQVAARLERYWEASASEEGSFVWQAAQSFATAILGAMQRTTMESPSALAYLQVRCQKQGEALWSQISPASVFSNQVYIADEEPSLNSPEGGSPRSIPSFAFQRHGLEVDPAGLTVRASSSSSPTSSPLSSLPPSPPALGGVGSLKNLRRVAGGANNSPFSNYEGVYNSGKLDAGLLRPLLSQKSLDRAESMMVSLSPREDSAAGGGGGGGGGGQVTTAAKTAEDLLNAALMMHC